MPVYRKKGTRDQWRIVMNHRGRQHERAFTGTKKEADAYEAELARALQAAEPIERRGSPRLTDYCLDEYVPAAKLHLKASSYHRQRSHLKYLLSSHLGQLRLSQLTAEQVEAYQRQRLGDGLKPVSVNNEMRALNRVLNHARERGRTVAKQTWHYLPEAQKTVRAYTRDQVEALLEACESKAPTIAMMVRTLVLTGMRRGEVMAMPVDHLDFHRGLIRIWPVEEDGEIVWTPKTSRREIPMPTELVTYFEAQASSGVRWAFPSRTKRRRVEWPKNQWAAAVVQANEQLAAKGRPVIKGGPHRLRHTYATWFLEARPDISLLAQLMGHSVAKTTELYRHLLPDHLARGRDVVSLAPAPPNVVDLHEQRRNLDSALGEIAKGSGETA